MPKDSEVAEQAELSGEVVTIPPKETEPKPPAEDSLTAFIRGQQGEVAERDSDPMQRIVEQILNAESAEAVLTPVEVMQAKDMVGVPFVLLDFELQQSEYDAGSPFYVSLAASMPPDGEVQIVNCGHKKVIAQVVKLRELGALPRPVKFITRGTSQHGTPMLELTMWSEDDGPPPF